MQGLEEAYRDGLVNVEHGAGPSEEPQFSLSEHGDAAANDLLREKESALLYLVHIHCGRAMKHNQDVPQALAELAVLVAENVGVNIYRVLARNLDEIDWLSGEAITEEQIAAVEEHIDENKERYNES